MISGTAFYCQRCEEPDAHLVVTELDGVSVTVLLCVHPKCGWIVKISETVKPPEDHKSTGGT